jgi:MFS-type transporter involved in bile tolerance (Atg22 family)
MASLIVLMALGYVGLLFVQEEQSQVLHRRS